MTTASLKLCRELYELSGWGGELRYMHKPEVSYIWERMRMSYPKPEHWSEWQVSIWPESATKRVIWTEAVPAYDLGYLLRKLEGYDCGVYYSNQWREWIATAHDNDQGKADTPEDAVCSLTIELFKSGVLK